MRFDPVLDEFFGVTNNKQDLTDIEWLAAGDMTDVADDAREGELKAISCRISKGACSNYWRLKKSCR